MAVGRANALRTNAGSDQKLVGCRHVRAESMHCFDLLDEKAREYLRHASGPFCAACLYLYLQGPTGHDFEQTRPPPLIVVVRNGRRGLPGLEPVAAFEQLKRMTRRRR